MNFLFPLCLLFFVVSCNVSPKQTPHNSMNHQEDHHPPLSNLKHSWVDKKDFPETKGYIVSQDSVERGKLIYQHHCTQCHGDQGKGDGPLAEQLKLKPSNLTNISKDIPHSYLSLRINKGKGSMPQWQTMLTSKQTWDLTNYVLSLSKEK